MGVADSVQRNAWKDPRGWVAVTPKGAQRRAQKR